MSESRVTWATSVPILVFLYRPLCSRLRPDVRNRRQPVRRQTASSLNASVLWGRKHNNAHQRQNRPLMQQQQQRQVITGRKQLATLTWSLHYRIPGKENGSCLLFKLLRRLRVVSHAKNRPIGYYCFVVCLRIRIYAAEKRVRLHARCADVKRIWCIRSTYRIKVPVDQRIYHKWGVANVIPL